MRSRLLALIVLASIGHGCSPMSSTPTTPSLAFVPGPAPTNYAGTIQDSSYGAGTVHASMYTVAGLTTGTFTMSFPGLRDIALYPSGTVSNNIYHANLSPCIGGDTGFSCSSSCTLVLDSSFAASAWSGTYTAIVTPACSARSGTIALIRE